MRSKSPEIFIPNQYKSSGNWDYYNERYEQLQTKRKQRRRDKAKPQPNGLGFTHLTRKFSPRVSTQAECLILKRQINGKI